MGIDRGSGEWDGLRRREGGNWDNCNGITIKSDVKKTTKTCISLWVTVALSDTNKLVGAPLVCL